MVIKDKELDELLNATEPLHRRAFNMSLYSLREFSIKPPNGIWEYKVSASLSHGKTPAEQGYCIVY